MWRVTSVLTQAGLSQPPPVSDSRREASSARGTLTHAIAQALALGDAVPSRGDAIDLYVDGVRQWFRDFLPIVLFTEKRVRSPLMRTTGQIDIGCLLDDGVMMPYIVDYKTGQPAASHAIQLAGYKELADGDPELIALRKARGLPPWRRAILYLPGNGRYKWVVHHDVQDLYLWRSALALVQWRFDHGLSRENDAAWLDNLDAEPGYGHAI